MASGKSLKGGGGAILIPKKATCDSVETLHQSSWTVDIYVVKRKQQCGYRSKVNHHHYILHNLSSGFYVLIYDSSDLEYKRYNLITTDDQPGNVYVSSVQWIFMPHFLCQASLVFAAFLMVAKNNFHLV